MSLFAAAAREREDIRKKTTTSEFTSSSAVGHPCTQCGLMFANKNHYDTHMQDFHANKDIETEKFVCGDCGKLFESFEPLRTHEQDHDVAAVIWLLLASKPSPREYARMKGELAVESKASTMKRPVVETLPKPVEKRGRPRKPEPAKASPEKQKHVAATPPPPSKFKKPATVKSHKKKPVPPPPSPKPKAKPSPVKSKSPPPQQINRPQPTKRPALVSSKQSTAPTNESPPAAKRQRTEESASVQKAAPVAPARPTAAASASIINSCCPYCQKPYPKPWELVSHMVETHQTVLCSITKKIMSNFSEDVKIFNKPGCHVCRKEFTDRQHCLRHLLAEHRPALFSTPDNTECTILIELQRAGSDQKYTVSVRVRKKSTIPVVKK